MTTSGIGESTALQWAMNGRFCSFFNENENLSHLEANLPTPGVYSTEENQFLAKVKTIHIGAAVNPLTFELPIV